MEGIENRGQRTEDRGHMRHTTVLVGLGLLLLGLGCDHTPWQLIKGNSEPPPPTKIPTTEELVHYLNDNSGRIQNLRTDHLALTVYHGQGITQQSFGLTGKVVCEKQRNLRLAATF